MSNMVNITEGVRPGLALVDMETGAVIGTNVRLVFIGTEQDSRLRRFPDHALAHAADAGVPVFADAENFVGTAMRDSLLADGVDIPDSL